MSDAMKRIESEDIELAASSPSIDNPSISLAVLKILAFMCLGLLAIYLFV